jgi:uncharacterized protein DUF4178
MQYLILILIFAVALGVTFALTRRNAAQRAARQAGPERQLTDTTGDHRQLRLGDAVGLDGALYLVEGTLRFDEDGFQWQEHLLVESETRLWLSVEELDDGQLLLVRWQRLTGTTLEPGPGKVSHDGTEYELVERGSASYTAEGKTGTAATGTAEYVDYASDERRLGFERYGDSGAWEVSVGEVLSPYAVDVYPGGGDTPR